MPIEKLPARLEEWLARGNVKLSLEGIEQDYKLSPIPDSPCRVGCPAGVNVKAYVGLIARGDFEQALSVVREKNPLPGICGRVCTHPCESECRRGEIDEPVAIRQLKRFIADYALFSQPAVLPKETPRRAERVAVVGSGPAGLTVANDLRRLGYDVTIFEAQEKPGGMLLWGIPPFRLPRAIIEEEINSILNLGIRLELNSRIDEPGQLLKQGYSAVFLAPGCQRSLKLGLPLEDKLYGIIDSLSFLRQVYRGETKNLTGRVLVIGGGDSAVDSARVAKRLGADEVWIVYRRSRNEMPAAPEEVREAEVEGVRFEFLTQPAGLEQSENKLTGLRCVRCQLGEPDSSGRRRPVPISGSDFIIDANLVITALGQKPAMEIRDLPPGVFIGGDAAGGPATVINAIASGHESAQAMHRFISGEETSPRVKAKELEMAPPLLTAVRLIRAKARVLPLNARRGFEEIEAPFTPEEAMQEAKRCLRCGPCAECVRCSSTCPKHQVVLKLQDGVEPVLLRIHGLDRAFTERGCRGRVRIKVEALNEEIGAEVELLTVRVVKELCRGCARCAEVCPHEAISLRSWQGIEVATVDYERCRGCGNCLPGCPTGALQWLSQTESFTNV